MLELLGSTYDFLSHRLPHALPKTFGLFEASVHLRHGSFDWILRHLIILSELELYRRKASRTPLRVLDFGGGDGSLARAIELYGLQEAYEVVVADVDEQAIRLAKHRRSVVEALLVDAHPPLPLGSSTMDAVVSSDVFEHIPPELRQPWATELSRVGSSLQVHTVPCDEPSAGYSSVAFDRAFDRWHQQTFDTSERWTSEHLQFGPPTLAELTAMFPRATFRGTVNSDVWLTIMRNDFSTSQRWHQLRNALWHPVLYRARGGRRPFKGCVIIQSDRSHVDEA